MKKILMLFLLIVLFSSTLLYGGGGGIPALQVTARVDSVSCHGGSDGAIYLTVSGGLPPQTSTKGLLISEFHADPPGNDSPFEFVELIATKDINFSVTPYTVIFVNNGVASANGWIAGGTRTYAFSINSGTVTTGSVVYVGGSNMLPLSGRLRAIDTGTSLGDGGIGNPNSAGVLGNDGVNADAIGVFDVPVSAITSSTVPIDAIFFGNTIGQALVSGGTAGYQLPVNDHYNGGKLQANSFLAPAPTVGTFTVASGVYNVQTNTFTVPRTWTINNAFTDLSSSISIEGAYNFQWNTGQTTQHLTGISAGNYFYTVTDGSGINTVSGFQTVPEPDVLQYDPQNIKPVTCHGGQDGELSQTASGGTPPYLFSTSAGSMTNLPAGSYGVTVTDSKGCTSAPYFVSITQPDPLTFDLTIADVTCFGLQDGRDSAHNASGGTGSYTFTFTALSGNVGYSDNQGNAGNLAPGRYMVRMEDDNGCLMTDTFNILQPDPISINALVTHASSATASDGSITLQVSGGTPPYQVIWDNGSSAASIGQLAPGSYCASVYDINSCMVDTCFEIIYPVSTGKTLSSDVTIYFSGKYLIIRMPQTTDDKIAALTFYSLGGSQLTHLTLNESTENYLQVNIAGWASGMYYACLWTEQGLKKVKKIWIP